MRNLVVTENITLDGVIDAAGGWFTPLGDVDTDDLAAANREHMATADAALLGRVTYEEFSRYWPKQTDDTSGVSDYLNRTSKYVVSSSLDKPEWQNTTILRGPLADDVVALKRQPGKDIVATGSVTLVRSLADTGLIDAYRLFVYPVVLGRGRRLFPDGIGADLRLTGTKAFRSGVVLLSYRRA
ncbi:MAG TPA: dihydrofolate reductase family protein [Ktedonobacterales bacterium]|jgi:dihydrofolate reductase